MSLHVAIIPDGNRRWARQRGLSPAEGHRKGAEALERLLEEQWHQDVRWFTFWAASVDNLTKRPVEEVEALRILFHIQFGQLANRPMVHERRVRIRVLGEWQKHLHPETQQSVQTAMEATAAYSDRNLTLLVAYDGIRAMVNAIQTLTEQGRRDASLVVTPEIVQTNLVTAELPPVDLVIRTGGEPHLSAGFLMWETANSQLVFTERLWPEFTGDDFTAALNEYHARTRRFGT